MTYQARPGDVFLLCSDGLTTMLKDDADRRRSLAERDDLDDAVDAAGRARPTRRGGRDNITVVAFRLEDAEARRPRPRSATLVGPSAEEAGLTADARRAAAPRAERASGERREAPARQRRRAAAAPRAAKVAGRASLVLAAVVVGAVVRRAPGLVPRHRRRRPGRALPRPSLRPAARDRALLARSTSSPVQVDVVPADRRDSATNHDAALPRRRRSPARRPRARRPRRSQPDGQRTAAAGGNGRAAGGGQRAADSSGGEQDTGGNGGAGGGSERHGERPQPRAARADPGRRCWSPPGFAAVFIVESNEIGDLSLIYGGYFLARLPRGPPLPPHPAALRRPLPVPALRAAGRDRPGDALPDRRRAWPATRPSVFVARAGPASRLTILLPARLPRARALPLPDRDRRASCCCWRRACRASARRSTAPTSASTSARSPSSRPSSRRSASSSSSPATCARTARCSRSRRRRVAGADDPAAQALRPAARRLGRGDADARLHPRPRQLADVLRRLPGAALRRHRPLLVRGRSAWRCSSSAPGSSPRTVAARPRPGRHLARPVRQERAGGRRARSSSRCSPRPTAACSAQGLGESLLKLPGPFAPDCEQPFPDCGSILPAPHTDVIYALIVNELGLFGACGRDPDLRADRRPRVQDRGDGPRRLLEAARGRADGGLRAPGVRDHRRRHQGDPADRRHPAVRQLRRQLGGRQHGPARAAAADLRHARRPRTAAASPSATARGCRREPPDRPPLRRSSCCSSRRSSASRPTGRSSTPTTSRTRPRTAAR